MPKSLKKKLSLWILACALVCLGMGTACTPELGSDPDAPKISTNPEDTPPTQTNIDSGTDNTPKKTDNNTDNSDSAQPDDESTPSDDPAPEEDPPAEEDPAPAACTLDLTTFPTGTSFFSALGDAGYEPSGAVWNATTQSLFLVTDDGYVSEYTPATGSIQHGPDTGYNLEAITLVDAASSVVYLGAETPSASVLEYDLSTSRITRVFDLSATLDPDGSHTAANNGLEALAFVPDPSSPEGGTFYAGLQDTGEIFIFELPIISDTTSTTVTPITKLSAAAPWITDLAYSETNSALYATYDNTVLLRISTDDGRLLNSWTLPLASDIEAFAIDTESCRVFLGQDLSAAATGVEGDVWLYSW